MTQPDPPAMCAPSSGSAVALPDVAPTSEPRHDTTPFGQLCKRLYRGWAFIVVCTLVSLCLAIAYLELSPPLYTAEMAIAPPMQNYADRTSGMLSGLGALAGLALGSESGTIGTPFLRYEKMLTSREVATRLVRDHHVLHLLFSQRWDKVHQTWKPPHTFAERLNAALNHMFGRPTDSTPDIADLQRFLTKRLDIEVPTADTALAPTPAIRYVRFRYRDPRVASQILLWLHEETDTVIRQDELNRTRIMISYLDTKLRMTTEVDERASLAQLLLDQERAEMLLTTGLDYSAEIIDPPGVPREPSYPQIRLTLLLGIFTGFILGSLIAITRQYGRSPSGRPEPELKAMRRSRVT